MLREVLQCVICGNRRSQHGAKVMRKSDIIKSLESIQEHVRQIDLMNDPEDGIIVSMEAAHKEIIFRCMSLDVEIPNLLAALESEAVRNT